MRRTPSPKTNLTPTALSPFAWREPGRHHNACPMGDNQGAVGDAVPCLSRPSGFSAGRSHVDGCGSHHRPSSGRPRATGNRRPVQRLPIAANGYIYVVNTSGTFAVFPAGDTLGRVAVNPLGEDVRCTPPLQAAGSSCAAPAIFGPSANEQIRDSPIAGHQPVPENFNQSRKRSSD